MAAVLARKNMHYRTAVLATIKLELRPRSVFASPE